MNSARPPLLSALVALLLLGGCSPDGPSPEAIQPSPSTTIYMPPEVPLDSIRVQGDPDAIDPTDHSLLRDRADAFDVVARRLAAFYGDAYLNSGAPRPGSAATHWIVLTDRPNRWALAQLSALPVDVEVKYGAPADLTELREITAALTSTLEADADEFARVEAAASRFATRVVVRYGLVDDLPEDSDPSARFDAALAAAAAAAGGNTLALPVRFVHDPALDQAAP